MALRWWRACPPLFGAVSAASCRAAKTALSTLVVARSRDATLMLQLARAQLSVAERVFGPDDTRTAAAASDMGTLVWKQNPRQGLAYFRRAADTYRATLGARSRPLSTSLYNVGLVLTRLGRLVAAQQHLRAARAMAMQLGEQPTARASEVSEGMLLGVAALKLQRWWREQHYGQAASQTTMTELTTLCSTLSWSSGHDDYSQHDGASPTGAAAAAAPAASA